MEIGGQKMTKLEIQDILEISESYALDLSLFDSESERNWLSFVNQISINLDRQLIYLKITMLCFKKINV